VATIYSFPFFAQSGGLVAYGPDTIEGYSRAAEYIDRVLRGARPQDLPVQAPNHYKLVVNMRTAKAIGLDVPPAVLARADEIIE
jgi:putative ABC transport system substrate-binding protein